MAGNRRQFRPSFDFDDPAVRTYPHFKLKVVGALLGGQAAVGAFGYFLGTQGDRTSPWLMALACIAGFTAGFPWLLAVVIGNIKRLRD